jgi:rhodanese-related sulfurtransferase
MEATNPEKVDAEAARREIAGGEALAVDVRSEEEWKEGHVPGAIHLPDGEPGAEGEEPEKDARMIVIARDGKLAVRAASALLDRGFDAVAFDGGMDHWISEDFNVQPTADPDDDAEL